MRMWVDVDACPGMIKAILFKAAERTGVSLTLVANQPIRIPPSPRINVLQVTSGFDVADNEIMKRLSPGDLVITSDIPLAAEAITKGSDALSPRGERYTKDTINARLTMRDFLETMRASGIATGEPPPISQRDRKRFADQLDRLLAKRARNV